MGRILVIGGACVDRLIRLAAPLRPGGRVPYAAVEERWGGGGLSTGAALIELGHDVDLCAALGSDATADELLAALRRRGFGTPHLRRLDRPTRPVDILLEPSGDRTILYAESPAEAAGSPVPDAACDLVYVNVRRLADDLAPFASRAVAVAQMPREPGWGRRAARVLIASRSDFPGSGLDRLWSEAIEVSSGHLRALVLTDGAADVTVLEKDRRSLVKVPSRRPFPDTVGAGDYFAAGLCDGLLRGEEPARAVATGCDAAARFLAERPMPPR